MLVVFLAVQVSAVEVYTVKELTVINGTEAMLKGTFRLTKVIDRATIVSWSFQAQGSPSAAKVRDYFRLSLNGSYWHQ